MEAQWLSDSEQTLWRSWLQVQRDLNTTMARQLSTENGLSIPDFEVLVMLSEAADQRMRIVALADALGWERSRASHHLARMTKRGLIHRAEVPNDGRGAYVALTDAGLDRIKQAAPGHVRTVRESFFDNLTTADMESLRRILSLIGSSPKDESANEATA